MLRIPGRTSLAAALLSAGLSSAEPPSAAVKPANSDKIMTLTGERGQSRRCQVLRTSKHPSGGIAYEVKDLESGEVMTVVENATLDQVKATTPATMITSEDPILEPKKYSANEKLHQKMGEAAPKAAKAAPAYNKPPVPAAQRWLGKVAAAPTKPAVAVVSPQPVEAVRHADPVIRLIGCLRDDMLPSMREVAAETLVQGDGCRRPEVIAALVEAAQRDPALSVRLCCIRCLAELQPGSPECAAALQGLVGDEEEAVRNAAQEALSRLRGAMLMPPVMRPTLASRI